MLDVDFPKRVTDALIAEGSTNDHRLAGGGWTSFSLDSKADLERAVRLLRISSLYTALTLRRKPAGQGILTKVDLEDELDSLSTRNSCRSSTGCAPENRTEEGYSV